MVYYPMVLVGCYFFGTISRIQQIFGPPVFALVILHTIGMSSQGTFNALVYGLSPSVKSALFGKHGGDVPPSINETSPPDHQMMNVELDGKEHREEAVV